MKTNVDSLSTKIDEMKNEIAYFRRRILTMKERLEEIELAHEYDWNPN